MIHRFFRIVLRTTDVERARAFYGAVFGERAIEAVPLHEQALARGARPHWLGLLTVSSVDADMARLVERGGMALSPTWRNPQGYDGATLRDPGGAVLGLAKVLDEHSAVLDEPTHVSWHVLNTADVQRARATYAELFGWEFRAPVELEGVGTFHPFAWQAGGPAVGALGDIAGRPGVHPHWLFHFGVSALDPAVRAVREHGGIVVHERTLPSGGRVAVCDDAQGAAFALLEGQV
jgi:predicted enzyme related to lactoylglutathione lyase